MPKQYIDVACTPATLDCVYVRSSLQVAVEGVLLQLRGIVLDVGCGNMPYRDLILRSAPSVTRYVGVDLPQSGYASPEVVWDGRALPFSTRSVGAVLLMEVLEHCFEPRPVLTEARRVLSDDGVLLVTVPFLWPLHDVPNDYYRYTPMALERHLRETGFDTVCIGALGGWDASLAQMLGLWVRRRPMRAWKRSLAARLLAAPVKWLIARDGHLCRLGEGCMITGLWATARRAPS